MDEPKLLKSLLEATRYFADPDVCTSFVASLRWPDGPVCPTCGGSDHYFLKSRRIWKCKSCKRQFSVKVGTIFEDSPIPLDKWLAGIWLIANAKNGISSYELARHLGIKQKSGWFMLHRIRLAMQTGSFDRRSGHSKWTKPLSAARRGTCTSMLAGPRSPVRAARTRSQC